MVSTQRDPMYGWVIVAAGAVLMGFGFGGLSSFAVFMKPLSSEFGWGRADISMAYTVGALAAAFGGLAFGQIVDRWSPRPAVLLGALSMGLALVSLHWLSSLLHLYVAVAVYGAAGLAACTITMNATMSRWFLHRRGFAIGVGGAGAALGQGLVPYAAQALVSAVQWRDAYLYLGLMFLAVGLSVAIGVRASPYSSARLDALDASIGAVRVLKPAEAMTWMAVAPIFCCICMAVPIMHIAPLVSDLGFRADQAAGVMAVMMVSGAFGRVIAGRLADGIGALNTFLVVGLTQTFFACWFVNIHDLPSLYAVAVVFGLGYAGVMTCLLVTTRALLPARMVGVGMSVTSLAGWLGMGVGAYLGGALYDLTSSYDLSFAAASIMGAVNVAILLALSIRSRRKTSALGLQALSLPRS
jgi:MFS family permease